VKYSGAQLQQVAKDKPKEVAHRFGMMLRDFGYPNLTDAECEAAMASYFRGDKAEDVIAMFIHGWLADGI